MPKLQVGTLKLGVGRPIPRVGTPIPEVGRVKPRVGTPNPPVGCSRTKVGRATPAVERPRIKAGRIRSVVGAPNPEVGRLILNPAVQFRGMSVHHGWTRMNTDKMAAKGCTRLVKQTFGGTASPSVSIRVHPWFNCFF